MHVKCMPVLPGKFIMKCSLFLALVFLLGACKAMHKGDVGMSMILPKTAERLEVPEEQQFLFPVPIIEPILPAYPPALLGSGIQQIICVEIVIDENGEVSHARPLLDLPECPSSNRPPNPLFTSAAISAVKQWQFAAAAICRFPKTVQKNDDCHGDEVVITNIAIKLAYTFTFSVKNNKSAVSMRH